jgi:predicted ATPase
LDALGAPRTALIHDLFTLFAAADETRPALIAIDDLHWSDTAPIEFMLYVLQRLEELPVAIVLTQRPRIGGESESLLDRIAANPRVSVQQLAPLGRSNATCATSIESSTSSAVKNFRKHWQGPNPGYFKKPS